MSAETCRRKSSFKAAAPQYEKLVEGRDIGYNDEYKWQPPCPDMEHIPRLKWRHAKG